MLDLDFVRGTRDYLQPFRFALGAHVATAACRSSQNRLLGNAIANQ